MGPRDIKGVVSALFGLAMLLCIGVVQADQSGEEIMKKNLLATKVADSKSSTTFRLITASGQERVRETDSDTKLIAGTTDNRRLVTFLSPSDVRGTKTLLVEHSAADDDIWIYLPAMKKVRRLVASNKRDSFAGTDFSYGDVIGYKVEEWNHQVVGQATVDGRDCWIVASTPKRAEVADNSGYSKRVGWIDKESYVALRGELYDQTGQLLKKIAATNVQKVDAVNNRYQPMTLACENVQTGHKTIIEFKNFKAGVGVSDEVFTTRSLEQ
jgi:outer membrane lipoprotein-sorting protein